MNCSAAPTPERVGVSRRSAAPTQRALPPCPYGPNCYQKLLGSLGILPRMSHVPRLWLSTIPHLEGYHLPRFGSPFAWAKLPSFPHRVCSSSIPHPNCLPGELAWSHLEASGNAQSRCCISSMRSSNCYADCFILRTVYSGWYDFSHTRWR